MTALLLIFAEVMPKTLAINYPDRMSPAVARLVAFAVAVFSPILTAVHAIVHGVLHLCGVPIGSALSLIHI